MKEILVSGNPAKDFERLDIKPILTYGNNGTRYKVYEVSEEEFQIMCDEPDIEGTWEDCGWRYCEGSTKGIVNAVLNINGKELKCWFEPEEIDYEDLDENYEEDDYIPDYADLLTYLCEQVGASMFKNVCALTVDLAKYNKMKLSELFKLYQG